MYIGQITKIPSAISDEKQWFANELEICSECKKKQLHKNWCNKCYSSHFKKSFGKWTSGNKILDKFIRKSQLSSVSRMNCLEWIPKHQLTDIKLLYANNRGSVYSAVWLDGFIVNWNKAEKCWNRINRCNYGIKVILKTFMKDDDDFSLHEVNILKDTYRILRMFTFMNLIFTFLFPLFRRKLI